MSSNEMIRQTEVREGVNLVAWDCIQTCNPTRCPVGSSCPKAAKDTRCSVQEQYIESFVDMMITTYRGIPSDELYRIGMHVIPLYAHLCKMKLVEKSLSGITFKDQFENPRIHPIYAEIRLQIKAITSIWKDLKLPAIIPALPPVAASSSGNGLQVEPYRHIARQGVIR